MKFTKFFSIIPLLALGFFVASPTFAATLPQAQNSPAGNSESYNWAGYVAPGSDFTSITGTWTVPSVTNSGSTTADATWVGIGGVNSSDLIQAGTLNSNGQTQVWFETLPQSIQPVNLTVSAGQSITVLLAQQSGNVWNIYFDNNSTGQSYQTSVTYNSSLSSAEWIEEMPASNFGFVPLDNFGSVNFTAGNAVENGQTVTIAGSGAEPMTMISQNGQALATPSALGADNESFTVTRSSVASTPTTGPTQGYGRGSMHRVGVGIQGYSHPQSRSSYRNFGFSGGGFQFSNASSFRQSFIHISF